MRWNRAAPSGRQGGFAPFGRERDGAERESDIDSERERDIDSERERDIDSERERT